MHKTTPTRIYQRSNKYLLRALLSIFLPILSFHSQIPNYVPSNGLVGWWPFNGNTNDESGNNNHGTAIGTITPSLDRFGNSNNAYTFNGNGRIQLPSINLPAFTINAWVKRLPGATGTSIVCKHYASSFVNSSYLLFSQSVMDNYCTPCIYYTNTSNIPASVSATGTSWCDNNWHMLTGTLDINALKIYFDGVLILSQTGSVAKSTAFNTLIGAQYSNSGIISNQNFGDIDDVGFWNRALTQCEINDLYDVQLGSQAISAGTNTSVCEGGGFVLNGTGGTNLIWNGGFNNGQTLNPATTTTYYLTGTDSVNCAGQDSVIVTVIPNQPAFFPSVDPICAGDPLAPLPTSSLNLFQGTWSPPINNMVTTTYTFNPSLNVCAWDTTTLTVIVKPIPVLTSQDINTCIGQEVNISSTPDLPNGTFSWSNNLTTNQFIITADTSTFYTATYILDGCSSETDTVKVVVNTLPLVSITSNGPTTFCAESTVNLTSSYNYGNLWNTSENTQSVTASASGTYQVIVTDSNGCVDSASITIINSGVPCLQIGGVFTPNGDGTNDTWQIVGIENYPDATVEIFNRWGQQLFFSKGYTVPWNGTYNNEQLPTGDYFYIIDLGINDPIKGALTIKN